MDDDEETAPLLDPPSNISTASSSLLQTTFNLTNIMMGISILSLPYALHITGWVVGVGMLVMCTVVAASTTLILIGIQRSHLNSTGIALLTYGDIGEAAFGSRGRFFIQTIFSCELFGATVALLLLAQNTVIDLLQPLAWDPLAIRLGLWSLLTISTWPKSLSILSYGSMVGVLCLLNLVIALFVDGLGCKSQGPGSLNHPMPTSLLPPSWEHLPASFGLIMAGFAGHACYPGLYASMKRPRKFPIAVAVSFSTTILFYLVVGSVGYLMFGDGVPRTISGALNDPDYIRFIYYFTLVLIAINPATKYPLTLYPVVLDIEIWLFSRMPSQTLERSVKSPPLKIARNRSGDDLFTVTEEEERQNLVGASGGVLPKPNVYTRLIKWLKTSQTLRRVLFRTFVSSLALVITLVFPHFDRVLSILGSFFAITSSVLFPILCYLSLYKTDGGSSLCGCVCSSNSAKHNISAPVITDTSKASSSRQSKVGFQHKESYQNDKQQLLDVWWRTTKVKRVLAICIAAAYGVIGVLGTVWSVMPGDGST